ncbi:MAG: PEP-CTERM sorting domain-containing protein [Rhodocyclaceae bacterium]|nr:PEP-CTERM sorting domain-containing protein [Rhodocyclaceae bacterium]
MITLRSLAAMGTSLLLTLSAGSVFAIPFTPVLDEFWIMKGSAAAGPTEIFRDSFNDTVLPPSGPDGSTTYFGVGHAAMTSESGGKLTMTPSLGNIVGISGTTAEYSTTASRLLATNPDNPNFLGVDSAFSIHGLFDMSNLPLVNGQSFGIRATDRALAIGNQGDNTYALFVGMNLASEIVVALRHENFVTNISTRLDSFSIQSLLPTAGQIELILSKEAGASNLLASYILYDTTGTTLGSGPIGAASTLSIYSGETYIRGGFQSTDAVDVPEPTTLALFGLGVAAIYLVRRRRVIT